MITIVHRLLEVLFVLLGIGTLLSFSKYRRSILLAGGATYVAAATVSYLLNAWWPLAVGFGLAYILNRSAGGFDPLLPSSYSSLPAFLTALRKDAAEDVSDRERAVAKAVDNPGIAVVLQRHGAIASDLRGIEDTLSRFGLGDRARRVIGKPALLEQYFQLCSDAQRPGWTEEDQKLYIATKLGKLL